MGLNTRINILIAVLALSLAMRVIENRNVKYNYLYQGSLNLNHHTISDNRDKNAGIIILGDSSVAGNNVPQRTTTADYLADYLENIVRNGRNTSVYNLGSMEQSLIESMIYLQMAAQYAPKLALIGINARTFPEIPKGRQVAANNTELLGKYMDSKLFLELKAEVSRKFNVISFLTDPFEGQPPPYAQLYYHNLVRSIRYLMFGNLYSKSIKATLPDRISHLANDHPISILYLEAFLKLSKELNIKPIFYFTPIHEIPEVYPIEEYEKYKNSIKYYLAKENVRIFDFDNLLPSNNQYFIDFIHMTPLGNQELARVLAKGIRDNDYI